MAFHAGLQGREVSHVQHVVVYIFRGGRSCGCACAAAAGSGISAAAGVVGGVVALAMVGAGAVAAALRMALPGALLSSLMDASPSSAAAPGARIGMSLNPHFLSPKNGLVIYPLTSLPAFLSSVDGPGWASESPRF